MSYQYGSISADPIISVLQSTWIENSCFVAMSTLVAYDYMGTVAREVELIWGRKISSTVVLFHLNRWMLLAWAIMSTGIEFFSVGTLSTYEYLRNGRIRLC